MPELVGSGPRGRDPSCCVTEPKRSDRPSVLQARWSFTCNLIGPASHAGRAELESTDPAVAQRQGGQLQLGLVGGRCADALGSPQPNGTGMRHHGDHGAVVTIAAVVDEADLAVEPFELCCWTGPG